MKFKITIALPKKFGSKGFITVVISHFIERSINPKTDNELLYYGFNVLISYVTCLCSLVSFVSFLYETTSASF